MPARKAASAPVPVEDFLAALEHPRLAEIRELRAIILGVDASIGESIKWNAPSFFTSEHFATMRLFGKAPTLQLILHPGTGKHALPRQAIQDPGGLLSWLAPDCACIDFADAGPVSARRAEIQAIVGQWLAHVPGGRPG